MKPFANTGYDTPFQGPDMGGLSFGASKSRFVFLVDSLIAGVRKMQEDVLKVFILTNYAACKQIKIWGNRMLTTTNTTYIYISEW